MDRETLMNASFWLLAQDLDKRDSRFDLGIEATKEGGTVEAILNDLVARARLDKRFDDLEIERREFSVAVRARTWESPGTGRMVSGAFFTITPARDGSISISYSGKLMAREERSKRDVPTPHTSLESLKAGTSDLETSVTQLFVKFLADLHESRTEWKFTAF